MIGSILSLILIPWKIETLENQTLHFGVWKICKLTPYEKPYIECFGEFYTNQNEEMEGWLLLILLTIYGLVLSRFSLKIDVLMWQ